ncbi:MAG TPA: hypothetical protein DD618_04355 [Acholeplasmatales bacterium]|nr:hypothetical protein [Acholeplasmatales bacterium]
MKKGNILILVFLIALLSACGPTHTEELQSIMDEVVIPKEAAEDLDLRSSYSLGTVTAAAEWQTTNPAVITEDGMITIADDDCSATLILRLSIGDEFITKQFSVTVKGRVSRLQSIMDSIVIPEEVTNDLDLKTSYTLNGITAEAVWQTTASGIIGADGKIHVTVSDQSATLILTLTSGDLTLTKHFDVIVKGNEDFLLLYATFSAQVRFSSYNLSENVIFPSSYVQDGKTVSAVWSSDNESVLESNGTVHQTDRDVAVKMTVTLAYGVATRTETIDFVVLADLASLPVNWWHTVSVWNDPIIGESADPSTPSCFAGAVYRKVVSSKDYWLGIEAVVTIPDFIPDPLRYDDGKMSYYLDNASLYMGGHANYESDVGLTWAIGYPDSISTAYTRSGICFRPFWRYITSTDNIYRNADVSDFQYYYFPGDKIRMSVFSPKSGYMQMRIELLEPTTHVKYANARLAYNLGEDFNRVFTTELFPSGGMGAIKAEFKRVNAIDQVSNEGKPTLNTNAVVDHAVWHEVYLYRKIDGVLYKVPMTSARSASMTCPLGSNVNGDFTNAFAISYDQVDPSLGGEVVTISPSNGTGKLYNLVAVIAKKKEEF